MCIRYESEIKTFLIHNFLGSSCELRGGRAENKLVEVFE